MLFNIFLNALILGIIIYFVTKGESKPDTSILLGLPLGLGILGGILSLFIGYFALIVSLVITIFALKWAFSMSTRQSLITTGIWILWQVIYSVAGELL
jgi:hypothetical protein